MAQAQPLFNCLNEVLIDLDIRGKTALAIHTFHQRSSQNSIVGELAKRLGYSCDLDKLHDQYQDYQLSQMEELPSLPSDCHLEDFWIWMEEVTLANGHQR
ncbi:hypothetical protein ScPMuIL_012127 [Solemya velum]